MAPSSSQQILLSPAELSYLHTSLTSQPPIRPDGRTSSQFRPLVAECDILPGTNGSARICFADGTEAIVGVKAEVEKSRVIRGGAGAESGEEEEERGGDGGDGSEKRGSSDWVELSVEIPGFRDDDSMPVFLGAMLSEALLADGVLTKRLWINQRYHWKLYLDILLLSQPLSYPLPLLSLTSYLALLSTRLPRLKSEADEDPLFDDDWDASVSLYPRETGRKARVSPPVTLLVMAVGDNIIFDPSKEELAVADVVLAVSVGEASSSSQNDAQRMDVDSGKGAARYLSLRAVRTIDPPSRLTHPGTPHKLNTATGGTAPETTEQTSSQREKMVEDGVWLPPRGGAKRKLIATMIRRVLEPGGVAEEVFDGLDTVELS